MLLCAFAAPVRAASSAATTTSEFRALYDEAQRLYAAGAWADALAMYRRALDRKPVPEALYGVARCLHQLGNYEDAAVTYEAFLATAPGHEGTRKVKRYLALVLAAAGWERLKAKHADGARAAFERARSLHAADDAGEKDAMSAEVLAGLGISLASLGAYAEARTALEKARAAKLAPDLRERVDTALGELPKAPGLSVPDTAPPGTKPPGAARSRGGLWLGVGVLFGGLAAAAGAVAVVLLVVRPGAPELGWHRYDYDGM